ncbi:MAG: dihydrodipicolinate synthase family protein [Sedimentisphaerales bacterium]|nr:dihydrodipicolinate synthase family protein [Sedimentisphaerales bacterium]
MEKIQGLIAAPFTPFDANSRVNLAIIEKLAEHYAQIGLAGIFINGTTGESLSLTVPERIALAEEWIKYARSDFRIIVHVGHNSIEACKQLASHAQRIGAWGVGAMGPCFFRPIDIPEFVNYCRQIASAAADLPFYYYHMPSMTGVNFQMTDFLAGAADHIPNLAGIKFTNENLMDYHNCLHFAQGRYDILFGRDEILLTGLALGAKGAVGSTYNYAAPLYYQLIAAFNAGDSAMALRLQGQAIEIVKLLKQPGAEELAVNKYLMLCFSGIDCGRTRTPIKHLTVTQKQTLSAAADDLKQKLAIGDLLPA